MEFKKTKTQRQPIYFLNKRVVITGASSGIGRALAYWYLNSGSKVALVSKSDQEELHRIAENFPGQALVCLVDLTIDMDVFELKQEVINKFGGVDILINCAGAIYSGDVESLFPQDYDYLMDLNLRSPFLLTLFFKKYLKHSQGCIVNISCTRGNRPEPGMLGYCMTKAGLEMFTQTTAMELAPSGVRVNAVAPCTVNDTNLYLYAMCDDASDAAMKKRAAANTPLMQNCDVEDVAKAVIFLTSEKAAKITGQIMKIDGGKSLTSKGQTDWYGQKYMTKKFEQDSSSWYSYMLSSDNKLMRPEQATPQQLDQWCNYVIQQSKWAIRSEEAHTKQAPGYNSFPENLTATHQKAYENNQMGGINAPITKDSKC